MLALATGGRRRIDIGRAIAVFSGVQGRQNGHSEDQILGVSDWGIEYAVPALEFGSQVFPAPRWRVTSSQISTYYSPDSAGFEQLPGPQQLLATAGDYADFNAAYSFMLGSSKPVALITGMVVSNGGLRSSMATQPPTDRLLDHYVVVIPEGNYHQHYLSVATPDTSTVYIDGVPVQPIANETSAVGPGWERRLYTLSLGVHVIDGDEPFAAFVHGLASSTGVYTYLYMAGMAF